MVLDFADLIPIARLIGTPLLDVAVGVDVRKAGNGAVCTAHVGAVDDDLVTGENLQRMAGVLVFEAEPAEGDVIARGVLNALDDAVGAQAHEHRGIKLRMNADRKVICEQGQVGMLANGTEMTLGLLRAAKRVERSGGNERVNAVARRTLRLVDDTQGFHVDDARENRNAAMNHGDGLLQHVITLSIGQKCNLTTGAQEEQAVDARIDHAVDGALERLEVERALLGQRNDNRGDNTVEVDVCHE